MKPQDPFQAEALENEKEAFEYSGPGQFLGEKLSEILDAIVDGNSSVESQTWGIERIEEKLDHIADQLEEMKQEPNRIAAGMSLLIFLFIVLIGLVSLLLWRIW